VVSTARTPLPGQVRRLAVVATLASTADWYVQFAVFWLAAERGYSGLLIAGLVLAARAPTLVGGLVGGRLIDRRGPRRMIGLDNAVRAALLLLLAVLAVGGDDGYLAILVVAAGCSLCAPVTYAGARALTPTYVRDDQLGRATTLLALADQVPIIFSAALAGPALTWLGPGAYAVPAVLLLVALGLAQGLPAESRRPVGAGLEAGAASALRYPPAVVALIALSTAYYFVYGPFQPLLPILVERHLGGGATTYAVLRVVVGLGALLGLLLAPYLSFLERPGLVNAWGAVLYGLSMLPLVFVHSVGWAVVIYFVSGVVWGPYSAVEATALQRWTRPEHHGRLFGTQRALIISAIPAGGAIGSATVDSVGLTGVLAGSAVACSVVGLLALAYPPLRRRW
jgi:predicted MFS family arabinose efflux permease